MKGWARRQRCGRPIPPQRFQDVPVLSVIGGLLALYLVWRLIWPLRLSRPVRIVLGLLVVALALHHRIVAQFAGTMASPEIPKAMIAVLATGFTTLLLSAVFVLLLDAID